MVENSLRNSHVRNSLLLQCQINCNEWRSECRAFNKMDIAITNRRKGKVWIS